VSAHGGGVAECDLVTAAANAVSVSEASERLTSCLFLRVPLGDELLGEHVDVEVDLVVHPGVEVAIRAREAEEAAQPRNPGHGPWPRHA
jgi:hypothetical protein